MVGEKKVLICVLFLFFLFIQEMYINYTLRLIKSDAVAGPQTAALAIQLGSHALRARGTYPLQQETGCDYGVVQVHPRNHRAAWLSRKPLPESRRVRSDSDGTIWQQTENIERDTETRVSGALDMPGSSHGNAITTSES